MRSTRDQKYQLGPNNWLASGPSAPQSGLVKAQMEAIPEKNEITSNSEVDIAL